MAASLQAKYIIKTKETLPLLSEEAPTDRMKEATEEDSAEAASNEEYNFKKFQDLVD